MADNLNGADITPDKDNITGSVNNSGIDSPVNDSDNITGNDDNTSPDNDSINNSSDSENKDDKGKRNGIDNLIPFNQRTEEQQREIAKMGGKASGEARKKKRDMREVAKAILEHAMNDEQIDEVLGSSKDLLDGDKSVMAVLTARMVQEAGKGSYKHYETLRDTAGFKPKDEIGISADIMTDADRELIEKVSRRLEKKQISG